MRPEYETFCLAYLEGRNPRKAFRKAYPSSKAKDDSARAEGRRLLRLPEITARIAELTGRVQEQVAVAVVNKIALDEAAVVNELARLAFSNIAQVCHWRNDVVVEESEEEIDGKTVITRTITPRVDLVSDADLDADTLAAIGSVSLTKQGTLTVKMHDKIAALKTLEERFRPKDQSVTNTTNIAFIDAPPRETYDQWVERRTRLAAIEDRGRGRNGHDREMVSTERSSGGRDPSDLG